MSGDEARQSAVLKGQRGSWKGQEGQLAPMYRASCSSDIERTSLVEWANHLSAVVQDTIDAVSA